MVLAIVLAPFAFAAVAFASPWPRVRAWLVPAGGAVHLALVAWMLSHPAARTALNGWIAVDPLGKLLLGFASVLFFLSAVYTPGYLKARENRPNRVFTTCLLLFLGAMSLIVVSHHLALMWVALESTTLASAPLLFFNRNARSLEAVWKYLMVGSVGVALALLGSLFLAYSALHAKLEPSLMLEDLVDLAPQLSKPWLHAAFILLFVGYGTKMGLAPMHTWKPDAYGEAPGLVGALLAGGLTSCAFMAILRFFRIISAAGDAAFAREVLIAAGLLSMAVGAVFMARQRDYKRMLAYSSVEHMGILALGVGIGGAAVFGSLLHLVNNGLTKVVLFLSAGNIHRAYGSKRIDHVRGAWRVMPASAGLFILGFLAVTGTPPFGPFVSELTIATAAIVGGRWIVAAAFLILLGAVFLGMAYTVIGVVQGTPPEGTPKGREGWLMLAPVAVALALVVLLGVYLPAPFESLLRDAALQEVGP